MKNAQRPRLKLENNVWYYIYGMHRVPLDNEDLALAVKDGTTVERNNEILNPR